MAKKEKVTDMIAVRVTPSERHYVEDLAAKYDLSISQIMRRALLFYKKKIEETGTTDVLKD